MSRISENSDLMKWWDEVANADNGLFADKLSVGSNKIAHWRCSNGHKWSDVIHKFVKRLRCPICCNKRVLRGVNDLPTLFPNLAKEWDEEANAGLDIHSFVIGSAKIVGWKCSKCGNKWRASIRQRTQRKTGCDKCALEIRVKSRITTMLDKGKCLADYPIADEWNYEKNEGMSPSQFLSGSNVSVWWKCPACSFEWKAKIANRTLLNRGCPCCTNKVVVAGINDLNTTHPQLSAEWHTVKNGELKSSMVTYGSGKKVWWLCPNGHSYKTSILHRAHGTMCPHCNSGRQTSFAEQAFYFYIKKIFPDAISRCKGILPKRMELDIYIPSQNLAIEYDGSFWHKGSSKRDFEKYEYCKEAKIKLIRVSEVEKTEIAADEFYTMSNLDKRKNLSLLIQHVIDRLDSQSNFLLRRNPRQYHSNVHVNLNRDQFEIQRMLVIREEDSLACLFPILSKEWHPTKNELLTPCNVKPGSDLKVWWKCSECGHEWRTAISHRVNNTGCPACYRKRIRTYSPNGKKIYQFDEDKNLIREWESISEAGRVLGINSSNISMCAKGIRAHAGGFIWRYEEDSSK